VVNVTGAGDSFVAGLGYGYMKNTSLKDTVKYAVAMSVLTIAHEDTIHPDMCNDIVLKHIEKLDWTEKEY
ncbi:MAG: PfkB family carbohydrate kinase, partial [Paraclostridium sordellii]